MPSLLALHWKEWMLMNSTSEYIDFYLRTKILCSNFIDFSCELCRFKDVHFPLFMKTCQLTEEICTIGLQDSGGIVYDH